jgi:trehalose 6-phosphate phosphatase
MSLPEDTVRRIRPISSSPPETAVLLDLDGTLAPIVERPTDVEIPTSLRRLLPQLVARFGLVAFISGREVSHLQGIVGCAGAAYSGNHGVQISRADGRTIPVSGAAEAADAIRRFAGTWTAERLQDRGIWLEDKGATLTFHYRTAAEPGEAARFLEEAVALEAQAAGLVAETGRMSLEIHPPGRVNKGTAARALLEDSPAIRQAISVGDDRTDVTIWHELRRLIRAGRLDYAVAVGVRSDESPPEVLTEADVLVDGVEGTEAVLRALLVT